MTSAKKLILIIFVYLIASAALSILYHDYRDAGWLTRHVRWTYLVWAFRGPLSAVEYGWYGLTPIWQHFWTFLAGSLVVLPFLSMPLWFKGQVSARLCGLGLVLWIALGASLFGPPDLETRIDRLIAVATDLR